MTRSLLRPIRTRRVRTTASTRPEAAATQSTLTPGTRQTLATIGALWLTFAVSASGATRRPVASLDATKVSAVDAQLKSLAT